MATASDAAVASMRDFWLVFLCTTTGLTGWFGHRQEHRAELRQAELLDCLYDQDLVDDALVHLVGSREPLRLPVAEAVAAQVIEGEGDRAFVAAFVLVRAEQLGPLGVQAVRRLLASDDDEWICAAAAQAGRCPQSSRGSLAADLAAVVLDHAARGRPDDRPAAAAAAALLEVGPRGLRELTVLAASESAAVRQLARLALQSVRLAAVEGK